MESSREGQAEGVKESEDVTGREREGHETGGQKDLRNEGLGSQERGVIDQERVFRV